LFILIWSNKWSLRILSEIEVDGLGLVQFQRGGWLHTRVTNGRSIEFSYAGGPSVSDIHVETVSFVEANYREILVKIETELPERGVDTLICCVMLFDTPNEFCVLVEELEGKDFGFSAYFSGLTLEELQVDH